MNSISLIGRITKDPELRTSSGGKSFVAFTVAVNEFSGGNQYTQFIPCIAWEKVAENMAKFLKKGAQIAVEGSLSVRQENANGQYNTIVNVRASRVHFLGGAAGTSPQPMAGGNPVPQPQIQNQQIPSNNIEFDLIDDNQSAKDDDSILWDD
ncbi:single-strand DNA-binding protein [Spiroplasma clarkii]|uniref:Single-stranded DNA-binding protein n=1 Tax=Spiroplasma clarkii TaxID=2139 RepID=A0A1Y0KZM2_9MOLU|nr:single-stranded DNA-binding protein [Spiroplasma clarkii]ARU90909.1 single-strand DNA-binding protein [Spiroplasma clarkii]ATX70360.1 single-strand DNA-binding protein [Spiroplasma clarkii]